MGRVGSGTRRRKCSGRRWRRWRRRLCLCHPGIAWTFRLDDSVFLLCRVLVVTGCGGEGGGGGRGGRGLGWRLLLWRFWRRPWLLGSGAQARSPVLVTTPVMEGGGGRMMKEGKMRNQDTGKREEFQLTWLEGLACPRVWEPVNSWSSTGKKKVHTRIHCF